MAVAEPPSAAHTCGWLTARHDRATHAVAQPHTFVPREGGEPTATSHSRSQERLQRPPDAGGVEAVGALVLGRAFRSDAAPSAASPSDSSRCGYVAQGVGDDACRRAGEPGLDEDDVGRRQRLAERRMRRTVARCARRAPSRHGSAVAEGRRRGPARARSRSRPSRAVRRAGRGRRMTRCWSARLRGRSAGPRPRRPAAAPRRSRPLCPAHGSRPRAGCPSAPRHPAPDGCGPPRTRRTSRHRRRAHRRRPGGRSRA